VAANAALPRFADLPELQFLFLDSTLRQLQAGVIIPEESRNAFIPCHQIPLNEKSETMATLYKTGTQHQLDAAYRQWLLKTIQTLESEKRHHEDS